MDVQIEGLALYSVICKINHSCDPNAALIYGGMGVDVGKTNAQIVMLRPLEQGEELFISYIDIEESGAVRNEDGLFEVDEDDEEDWVMISKARRVTIQTRYGFDCTCEKCTFEMTLIERGPLEDGFYAPLPAWALCQPCVG